MSLLDGLGLTPDQQKAAMAPGSVAVVAGAGTGKTHMLVGRYLYHLVEQGLSPLSIVAVTFTKKAADELRSRIRAQVGKHLPDRLDWLAELEAGPISTLHSLAARICREHPDAAGVPADFQTMDEQEQAIWLAEQLPEVLGRLPDETFRALPYSLVAAAMRCFLKDPGAATAALVHDATHWQEQIDRHVSQAVREFLSDPEIIQARQLLQACRDRERKPEDKAAVALRCILQALTDLESGVRPLTALADVPKLTGGGSRLGAAANWTGGDLEAVRGAVTRFRDKLDTRTEGGRARFGFAGGMLEVAFGDADRVLAEQLPVLSAAWRQVREDLAARKWHLRKLDFADLELHAVKALQEPQVQAYYAARWQAFIIDEFQDTNPVQEQLLTLLRHAHPVTVVGDEQQAIYGFRGADVDVFRRVRTGIRSLPNGEEVRLDASFRTHKSLVDGVNAIFRPVLQDSFQALRADRTAAPHDGPHIECLTVQVAGDVTVRQQLEAAWIARRLVEWQQSGLEVWDKRTKTLRPMTWGDVAILADKWSPLDVISEVLTEWGIPHVHAGGDQLLETRPAKDGLAWLQALSDRRNDVALVAVLRGPAFAIADTTLYRCLQETGKAETWWGRLQQTTEPELRRAGNILAGLRQQSRTEAPHRLLQLIDRETGYTAILRNLPNGGRRLADWQGFVDLVRNLGAAHGDLLGVVRHLQRLVAEEVMITRPSLEAKDAVSLMSVHASKGLEWPIVVVANMAGSERSETAPVRFLPEVGVGWKLVAEDDEEEGDDPGILSLLKALQKQRNTAEGVRKSYVALTRGRDRLLLTAQFAANAKQTDMRHLDPYLSALDGAWLQTTRQNAGPEALPVEVTARPAAVLDTTLVDGVAVTFEALPVSSLTEYALCPRRFELAVVKGHAGAVGKGDGEARRVGVLAHHALEHSLDDIEALRPVDVTAPEAWLEKALHLARTFRTAPAFAGYRDRIRERETPISVSFGGITWEGRVDAVGDDFVLDYKTGRASGRDYRFQLWLYAKALNMQRAVLADLERGEASELTAADLREMAPEALALVDRLAAGQFQAIPTEKACCHCPFNARQTLDQGDIDAVLCAAAI